HSPARCSNGSMTGSRMPAGQRTTSVFDLISTAIGPPLTRYVLSSPYVTRDTGSSGRTRQIQRSEHRFNPFIPAQTVSKNEKVKSLLTIASRQKRMSAQLA